MHNQFPELVAGEGFFVNYDEISELHNKIPTKLIVGIGSIYGNVGNDVMLYAVMIISESTESFVVRTKYTKKLFELDWGATYPDYLEDSHIETLKIMFKTSTFDQTAFKEIFEHVTGEILFNETVPYRKSGPPAPFL